MTEDDNRDPVEELTELAIGDEIFFSETTLRGLTWTVSSVCYVDGYVQVPLVADNGDVGRLRGTFGEPTFFDNRSRGHTHTVDLGEIYWVNDHVQ